MKPSSVAGPSPRGGLLLSAWTPIVPTSPSLAQLSVALPGAVMTAARCDGWLDEWSLHSLPSRCPSGGPRRLREAGDALQLSCGGGATVGPRGLPSSSISPQGSAPYRAWAPGPFLYILTTSVFLTLCLLVTESEGPVPGGSLGGGARPCLPSLFLALAVALVQLPLPASVPVEACLVPILPMPSVTRNLVPTPFQSLGRRRGGKDGQGKGV